ncbi:hypothetical protein O2N63_03360 [Aliiroseovarius sp. KMU-50]|uniref:Uncharacterized protein n=1 Tax=Aliiroseovarius salicola TaxID=3009082 RepID=A0ABT4VXY5_9RHOB|nr:hypothetical protein [Aliiroseovarius sp. KMU-50]MDA5093117.1 hypothetical protein [Aliiroseovarius sp. KMU-50]
MVPEVSDKTYYLDNLKPFRNESILISALASFNKTYSKIVIDNSQYMNAPQMVLVRHLIRESRMRAREHIAKWAGAGRKSLRHSSHVMLSALGILALVVQIFSANVGLASTGSWIEICSEVGVSYVQLDADGNAIDQADNIGNDDTCIDCGDCDFCSTSMTGQAALLSNLMTDHALVNDHALMKTQIDGFAFNRAWPETRGPPLVNNELTDRALRAFMVVTLLNGGAL